MEELSVPDEGRGGKKEDSNHQRRLTDIFQDLENRQKFVESRAMVLQLVATPLLGPVEIWVKIQLLLALPSSSSV